MSEPKDEDLFAIQQNKSLKVYHLSHDLRGPLNSILGFAELLLEGIEGPLNSHQMEDIAAMYQSAKKLLRLINDLVDLSKLDANQLRLGFQAVDVAAVIEEVLAFDFGPVKPAQIELMSRIPENLPFIWGDRDRVAQMILSLLRFAFKFKRSGPILIAAAPHKGTILLGIELPGIILPDEEANDLFELVVYVDQSGHNELGIGGLELPLAYQLARQHNGRLWLEHNPHLNFYLRLPLAEETQ